LLVGRIAPTARGFARKERKKRTRSCMSIFMLDMTDIPYSAVEKHPVMQFSPLQNLQTSPSPRVAYTMSRYIPLFKGPSIPTYAPRSKLYL
jgi:hypothetical protein